MMLYLIIGAIIILAICVHVFDFFKYEREVLSDTIENRKLKKELRKEVRIREYLEYVVEFTCDADLRSKAAFLTWKESWTEEEKTMALNLIETEAKNNISRHI